ncbi:MAG: amidophosphoribosyltransferase, partial [Thermotogae bacterium]
LVSEVFSELELKKLAGSIGMGHVRYSTTGDNTVENSQPLVFGYSKGQMSIAHNGNLVNASALRKELQEHGFIFQTTTDSEIIAATISREISCSADLIEALQKAMMKLEGSFSLIIMTEDKLIAVRDPHGFRPLCLGRLDNCIVVASETAALDTLGANYEREISPGEILVINNNGVHNHMVAKETRRSLCVFEFVYFARPDSTINGITVYSSRLRAGINLAREKPVDADLVVGVPDSGTVAAMGFSQESGIPLAMGLIKNRYIGRTFIQPMQRMRKMGVRLKLNVLKEVVRGKRLVLVDDSIVRGTTSAQIVRILKDAGASQVHVRVASPPVTHSCYYGIDTSSKKELIAANHELKTITDFLGADTLEYLSLEGLIEAVGTNREELCAACFDGKYPTKVTDTVGKRLLEK